MTLPQKIPALSRSLGGSTGALVSAQGFLVGSTAAGSTARRDGTRPTPVDRALDHRQV